MFPYLNACRQTDGQTEEFKDAKASNIKIMFVILVWYQCLIIIRAVGQIFFTSLINIFTVIHPTIRIFRSVDPQPSLFHV